MSDWGLRRPIVAENPLLWFDEEFGKMFPGVM